MPKITPFLWFNDNAEDAMNFYVSIFKNSTIGRVTRYGAAGPGPKGQVMSASFTLEGQEFMAVGNLEVSPDGRLLAHACHCAGLQLLPGAPVFYFLPRLYHPADLDLHARQLGAYRGQHALPVYLRR